MPKNKAIYLAVLVIAASALLYLGHILTHSIRPILPWATGAGILLLMGGIFYEARSKRAMPPEEEDRRL